MGASERGGTARPFAGPPVTLASSWPGRVGRPAEPPSSSPARRSPFPSAERRPAVPQPVGRAGERFRGPGVVFTQLSGAPGRGGSGGGSAGSACGVWRRHLPGFPTARAAAPAPRLPRPRRREKGFLRLGTACVSALPPISVRRRLRSVARTCHSPKLTSSGAFVNFI